VVGEVVVVMFDNGVSVAKVATEDIPVTDQVSVVVPLQAPASSSSSAVVDQVVEQVAPDVVSQNFVEDQHSESASQDIFQTVVILSDTNAVEEQEEDLYNFPVSALEMSLADSQQRSQQESIPAAQSVASAVSSATAQAVAQRKSLRVARDGHGNAILDAAGNPVKEEQADPCCGLCCFSDVFFENFCNKVWDCNCCGGCGDFCMSVLVCCCTCDNKCNTPVKEFEKRRSLVREVVQQQQQQQPTPQVITREFISQADVAARDNQIERRPARVVGPAGAAAEMRLEAAEISRPNPESSAD
jgi:hypothetical protein